jgi:hypothetical protein
VVGQRIEHAAGAADEQPGQARHAGWRKRRRPSPAHRQRLGGWRGDRIEFWQHPALSGSEPTRRPIDPFDLEVEDVTVAYEVALAAGAKPDLELGTVISGELRVDTAFIRGPDGERIELLRFY